MAKNKILVTGATGFIGKSVCRLLSEKKYEVITHNEINLDVTQPDTFHFSTASEIRTVIHLAGKTFVPDSWKNPAEYMQVNAMGTLNLAEFCRLNDAHLIYISAYIYGNTKLNPISETHPPAVNNPYALSKKTGEDICLFYKDYFQVPVTIIRPFNVYGPGQSSHFLIPEIIKQVREGKEIRLKDLTPKRDFIHVKDVAGIILKALEKKAEGIFNAGTGKSHSVEELVNIIQAIAKTHLPVISENIQRENEISDTVADISKAFRDLQWNPEFSLETGIENLLQEE